MQLYNLPLNPSTAVIKSIYGNFTAAKAQEVVLVKTKSIELYSISDQYLGMDLGASWNCWLLSNCSVLCAQLLPFATTEYLYS